MLVQVGIPVLDGKPHWATVDSLLAETVIGQEQGVHLLVEWIVGCSLITAARNTLMYRFEQQPKSDCIVMVDADISWSAGDLIKLAKRPESVIGATYRAKEDYVRFNVGDPLEKVGDLYKVGGLPGGFLKISREVLGKIGQPYMDEAACVQFRDYFPLGIRGEFYYGEDYGFCNLWRESGGDVWLDPSIILKHWDSRVHYTGDPREWIEANACANS